MSAPRLEGAVPSEEAQTAARAPAVAREVPVATDGVNEHFVSLLRPASFEAEQYRVLRYQVEQLKKGAKVIAVTSPGAEDGKTTTAVNLAAAMAQSAGARVLLADADLRRPSVASGLGIADGEGPGLVGAILDPRLDLADVVRTRPPFALSILPAGHSTAMPYDLLQSPRLAEILGQARRQYDHVVIDTPPFLVVPDSRLLESMVDGFLLVVAANKTPRRLVEETLNEMDETKLLGLVFNRDDRPLSASYGSYYNEYHRGTRRAPWARWF